jgi:hypothetical protein
MEVALQANVICAKGRWWGERTHWCFLEFCTCALVTFGPHRIHNRKGDNDGVCS